MGYNNYQIFSSGSSSGSTTITEDLSDQCNGVTKVFTTNNAYVAGTIQLFSTQFPIVYRPTTDFTESGATEVTLTSEVGAPKAGQTLIAIYAKE